MFYTVLNKKGKTVLHKRVRWVTGAFSSCRWLVYRLRSKTEKCLFWREFGDRVSSAVFKLRRPLPIVTASIPNRAYVYSAINEWKEWLCFVYIYMFVLLCKDGRIKPQSRWAYVTKTCFVSKRYLCKKKLENLMLVNKGKIYDQQLHSELCRTVRSFKRSLHSPSPDRTAYYSRAQIPVVFTCVRWKAGQRALIWKCVFTKLLPSRLEVSC